MTKKRKPPKGSQLFVGNKLVWQNPANLGHFGIKLRKQVEEERLAAEMEQRISEWLPYYLHAEGDDLKKGEQDVCRDFEFKAKDDEHALRIARHYVRPDESKTFVVRFMRLTQGMRIVKEW